MCPPQNDRFKILYSFRPRVEYKTQNLLCSFLDLLNYSFQIFFKNLLPSSIKIRQFFRVKIADIHLIISGLMKFRPQISQPSIDDHPIRQIPRPFCVDRFQPLIIPNDLLHGLVSQIFSKGERIRLPVPYSGIPVEISSEIRSCKINLAAKIEPLKRKNAPAF